MGRFARVVAVDIPHHVTQRGNARQVILGDDGDRLTYLALLERASALHGMLLLGYCLMSNHVHLIAIPQDPGALAQTLKQAHGRYATYWNARQSSSGHVWQGRFYSCPLDQSHVWRALRYVELNPVRARMVARPEQWAWSSAAAHTDAAASGVVLEMKRWADRWTVPEWREFLEERQSETEWKALRQCTHTGRPLGDIGFVSELEKTMLRSLAPQKGGRPKKATSDPRQRLVSFVA